MNHLAEELAEARLVSKATSYCNIWKEMTDVLQQINLTFSLTLRRLPSS